MLRTTQVGQDRQDDGIIGRDGLEGVAASDGEGPGSLRREYPAVLSPEQLDAVAKHFLKNCQEVWRPNPEREPHDPDKDLVYETLFADEISGPQGAAIRESLGIGAAEVIYVLWDKKFSSFFKATYESLVVCDSGVYYRTKEGNGHLSWESFRGLSARAIRGVCPTLVMDGVSFRCRDASALMMLLQKIRSELVYARNWSKQEQLTFEVPDSRAMRARAGELATAFLKREAPGAILHTSAELGDADDYECDVRLYLDIPEEDVIYAAYEWSYDSDNPFPETIRELPPSYGAFAFTQSGFYTCVDDDRERSHTRLISWDEFADVMARDFAPSPDGANSLIVDNTLFGNLGEGVNLYSGLIGGLCDILESAV